MYLRGERMFDSSQQTVFFLASEMERYAGPTLSSVREIYFFKKIGVQLLYTIVLASAE